MHEVSIFLLLHGGHRNWIFCWKTVDIFLEGSKTLEISFGIAMWANRSPWKKIQMNDPSYIIVYFSKFF